MTLGPQFWGLGGKMFHISPSSNRESIANTGLEARDAPVFPTKGQLTELPGVYVSNRPHPFGDDMDVYEVDTSNLPAIEDDLFAIDRGVGAHFVPGAIPPDRIRRLEGNDRRKVDMWANKDRANLTNPFTGEAPHRPTVIPEMQDAMNRMFDYS